MYGVSCFATTPYATFMDNNRAPFNLTLNEVLTLQSSISKGVTRILGDGIILQDTVIRGQYKILRDSITLSSFILRTSRGFTVGIWERIAKVSTIWTRTPRP